MTQYFRSFCYYLQDYDLSQICIIKKEFAALIYKRKILQFLLVYIKNLQ